MNRNISCGFVGLFGFFFPHSTRQQSRKKCQNIYPVGSFVSVIKKIKENLQMIASNCFGGWIWLCWKCQVYSSHVLAQCYIAFDLCRFSTEKLLSSHRSTFRVCVFVQHNSILGRGFHHEHQIKLKFLRSILNEVHILLISVFFFLLTPNLHSV